MENISSDYSRSPSRIVARQSLALLEWSAKEGSILTGGGTLERYYKDFSDDELPHDLLSRNECRQAFETWAPSAKSLEGVWSRPLFSGGFEESTESDTVVRNVQTPSLFVDLRIPILDERKALEQRAIKAGSFGSLSDFDLRLLARQHCFAGFSKTSGDVCTRHHCIDWNYHPQGLPRTRPNKWRFELNEGGTSFKEFSVAHDEHAQAVYMERWARVSPNRGSQCYIRQGPSNTLSVFLIVGKNFALARRLRPLPKLPEDITKASGMGGIVDALLEKGHRSLAQDMLHFEGSFGSVETWKIEFSTIPWRLRERLEVEMIMEGGLMVDGEKYDSFTPASQSKL